MNEDNSVHSYSLTLICDLLSRVKSFQGVALFEKLLHLCRQTEVFR